MATIIYDVNSGKPLVIGYVEETGVNQVRFDNFEPVRTDTTISLSIEGIGLLPVVNSTIDVTYTMTIAEGKTEAFLVEKNSANTIIRKSPPFMIVVKHNGRIAQFAKSLSMTIRDWFGTVVEELKRRITIVEGGLASEITRATNAEGVLTTNLAQETVRAVAAEEDLDTAISDEVTRAEAAEATKIPLPTTAPTAADKILKVNTVNPLTTKWADETIFEETFFWVEPGTTTYAQITSAIADSKMPVMIYAPQNSGNAIFFTYAGKDTQDYHTFSSVSDVKYYEAKIRPDNQWQYGVTNLEKSVYKTNDVETYKTDTNHYPSTKGVADYVTTNLSTKLDKSKLRDYGINSITWTTTRSEITVTTVEDPYKAQRPTGTNTRYWGEFEGCPYFKNRNTYKVTFNGTVYDNIVCDYGVLINDGSAGPHPSSTDTQCGGAWQLIGNKYYYDSRYENTGEPFCIMYIEHGGVNTDSSYYYGYQVGHGILLTASASTNTLKIETATITQQNLPRSLFNNYGYGDRTYQNISNSSYPRTSLGQGNVVNRASFAIGNSNISTGQFGVTIGLHNTATNDFSVSIGNNNFSSGIGSVALGKYAKATAENAIALGFGAEATVVGAFAAQSGKANSNYAAAFGKATSSGNVAFAINENTASGNFSFANGRLNTASGNGSHAEGLYTEATKAYTHTEGYGTYAGSNYQHAEGKYNVKDTASTYAHIIGNGTSEQTRSNAHTLDWSGNAEFAGDVIANGCGGANPISLSSLDTAVTALDKYFYCTYGTTTYAQIQAAVNAGKIPVCVYTIGSTTSKTFIFGGLTPSACTFNHFADSSIISLICSSSNSWMYTSSEFETVANFKYHMTRTAGSNGLSAFTICSEDKDGRITPIALGDTSAATKTACTTPFRPESLYIYNYGQSISPGGAVAVAKLLSASSSIIWTYTFNSDTPANNTIYLVGTYNKPTGLFTLDNTSTTSYYKYVPNNTAGLVLSDYFTAGKYYIQLGHSAAYTGSGGLELVNPMYYFDGTNLVDGYTAGGVTDVQINGTSITQDGVANIPKASNVNLGVVKIDGAFGVTQRADGTLTNSRASNAEIDGRDNYYKTIVPVNLKYAVDSVLCSDKASEALTSEQQTKACERLGAVKDGAWELLNEYEVTDDTPDKKSIEFVASDTGTPYNLKAIRVECILAKITSSTENTTLTIDAYENTQIVNMLYLAQWSTAFNRHIATELHLKYGRAYVESRYASGSVTDYLGYVGNVRTSSYGYLTFNSFNKLRFYQIVDIPNGTIFKIYGIRA